MSDWDDLFASAAGLEIPEKSSVERNPSTKEYTSICKSDQEMKIHPTKKRRLQNERNNSDSRMDYNSDFIVFDALPPWMEIGTGLGKPCANPIFSDDGGLELCQICHLTTLHHALNWKMNNMNVYNGSQQKILELFLQIRNLRASCSCILMLGLDKTTQKTTHLSPQDYFKEGVLKSYYNLCSIHSKIDSSMLPKGEYDVLHRKMECVTESKHDLQASLKDETGQLCKKRTMKRRRVFQNVVRCIMACDDFYYRLYYLQVAEILARDEYRLPHPTSYFGSNNLTWDNRFGRKQRFRLLENLTMNHSSLKEVTIDSFGLDIEMIGDVEHSLLDPLTFLHQNRLCETILIFWSTGWLDSEYTLKEYHEAFHRKKSFETEEDKFYRKHETIAPLLLSDWRDSCRDLLCNLYGYATIPPNLLFDVVTLLHQLEVTNLIEMGAGTGYLGQVLRRGGFNVDCYDLAPPQLGANEYHGHVKPFMDVKRGSVKDLPHILSGHGKNHSCGLLLCFPPPMVSMAEDMLHSFIKSGGSIVVHIGEFGGLTGSPSFEHLLSAKFELCFRKYCLSWGTDASILTVWKLIKKQKKCTDRPITLPCVHCKTKQSTIRLSVSRNLSFCCKECFESFSPRSLRAHLQISMIPESFELDYDHQSLCYAIL